MGLSYMVYPGAHHTRFQHAIGCMHLMQKAVRVLRFKGVYISDDEENAVYIAILLHDIGHGAFSHALENSIVTGISHESISLKFMEALNEEFEGKLSLAITIFKGDYQRNFLHQLISSQLDMDRLDYLKRDSFFTGVSEGNINSERLITMLNVKDDNLVVEEKGIYSVEKFIVSRRLMYWQVYLHKTGLVAENILVKILKRAKELVQEGRTIEASKPLKYFLENPVDETNFNSNTLEIFSRLDDFDVLLAIKEWVDFDDRILSELCKMLINRKLFKIEIQKEKFDSHKVEIVKNQIQNDCNLTDKEVDYFFISNSVTNQAYNSIKNQIKILDKSGNLKDLAKSTDNLNLEALSVPVIKYFLCYPKTSF